MKKHKKFLAIAAVVAGSVLITTPISAKAAFKPIIKCDHELILTTLINEYSYEWEDEVHMFFYTNYYGDNYVENVEIECTKRKIYQVYEQSCSCGEYKRQTTESEIVHLDPRCTD